MAIIWNINIGSTSRKHWGLKRACCATNVYFRILTIFSISDNLQEYQCTVHCTSCQHLVYSTLELGCLKHKTPPHPILTIIEAMASINQICNSSYGTSSTYFLSSRTTRAYKHTNIHPINPFSSYLHLKYTFSNSEDDPHSFYHSYC